MLVVIDSRGYGAYQCGRGGCRRRCEARAQTSVRIADPQLDRQVGTLLGDLDTLRMLLDAATRERARDASVASCDLTHRAADLANRRERLLDAYESGALALSELRKRISQLDAERAAVEAAMEAPETPDPVPDEVLADIVEVFASWASLRASERRALLRAWRIELYVERVAPGILRVERLRIGAVPGDAWIYKKMQRLGIA